MWLAPHSLRQNEETPKSAGSLNSLPSAQKICVFPAGTFSTSSKVSDNFQQTRPVAVQHHYPLGYQPSFTETASITAGMSNAYPPRRQVAYTPSQQSVMSEFYHVGSVRKLNESIPPPGQGLDQLPPKKNKMESLRQFFAKPCSKLIFLFLILLVLAGIIVAIVLSQTLGSPKHFNFSWLAPHSLRQNDETPNRITMDIDGNQISLERCRLRDPTVPCSTSKPTKLL